MFDWDNHGPRKTCIYRKTWVRKATSIRINHPLWENTDHQRSDERNRINKIPTEWVGNSWKISIENLIDCSEPRKFLVRNNSLDLPHFFKKRHVFSQYRFIRIVTRGFKAKLFKQHTLVQVEGFRLRRRWKNSTLVFGGKWDATSRIINTKSGFRHILIVRITEQHVPAETFSRWNFFWPRKH